VHQSQTWPSAACRLSRSKRCSAHWDQFLNQADTDRQCQRTIDSSVGQGVREGLWSQPSSAMHDIKPCNQLNSQLPSSTQHLIRAPLSLHCPQAPVGLHVRLVCKNASPEALSELLKFGIQRGRWSRVHTLTVSRPALGQTTSFKLLTLSEAGT
jgi:hypothetical protein